MKFISRILGLTLLCSVANAQSALATCDDGLDNDGDGWIDKYDPDCGSGDTEVGYSRLYTCNNGQDDDFDGRIDARDSENCTSGYDEESGNCADSVDNDGDGWVDSGDPDCMIVCVTDPCYVSEVGYSDYSCNDGRDNDGDGAIDARDDNCATSLDEEDGGSSECSDGVDNDRDGWIDRNDPDCGSGPAEVGFDASYGCNNGTDDDHDGLADSADKDNCGSGYDTETGNCEDGHDNDGDGWADYADPDCPMVDCICYFSEVGYSSDYECNDGLDNDQDGAIDARDSDCDSAFDTDEASAGCSWTASAPLSGSMIAFLPLSLVFLRRRRTFSTS